jgi:hypothetical protein
MDQDFSVAQRGKNLFREGRYEEAIKLLHEYLRDEPNDIQARVCLAASYAQSGRMVDAISEFNRLAELDKTNPQHLLNLGIAYENAGDRDKAKDAYERALAIDPNHERSQQRLHALETYTSQPTTQAKSELMRLAPTGPAANQTAPPALSTPATGAIAPTSSAPPQPAAPPPSTVAPPRPAAPPPSAAPPPQQPVAQPVGPPLTTGTYAPRRGGAWRAPAGVNWGGFFISFWWSIAHSAWIYAVLAFFFEPVMAFVLLFTGNEVAYQNRSFSSLDEFKKVQKAWTIWGGVYFAVRILLFFIILVPTFMGARHAAQKLSNADPNAMFRSMDPNVFNMGPGGSSMFNMSIAPGQGNIATVAPFPGSQKTSSSNGSDEKGACTAVEYTASATADAVYEYFKGVGQQSGSSSTSSSGESGNASISTKTGLVDVTFSSSGANQVKIVMKTYGK